MAPVAVIKAFDVFLYRGRRVGAGRVALMMNQLIFQAAPEALHGGVVVTVPPARHGRLHAELLHQFLIVVSAIQFTSQEFTNLLRENGIAISMDGRGCWRDNVFVERLWKSIKYEEVYLRAYETVSDARSGIARYIDFYNSRRPHSSLDAMTPDAFYFKHLPAMQRAA